MPDNITYRNVVHRVLPQRRGNWRWLEWVLEEQRQLYNAALEERIDCYRKTGKSITRFDQFRSLTECRRGLPEMKSCPVPIQRGTLSRLDEAFQHFFRRVKTGEAPGFPKFRGRRSWNSFEVVSGVKVRGDLLHVPGFGGLRIRRRGGNLHADGTPRSATLKRENGKWYAIICYAVKIEEPADNGIVLGLDRNAGQVADSGGVIHDIPGSPRLEARTRRLQRKLKRQSWGSRRRERTKRLLAKTRRRAAINRHNRLHHVSRRIADRAGTVVIEDLRTKNMTGSTKGTVEEPGRNVAAKSGLNRVILETGWGILERMLEYKCGSLVRVPAHYTSQTCHVCGEADARSRRSQARYECVHCGHAAHADINAANNIKALGIGASARRGAFGLPIPATREINAKAA